MSPILCPDYENKSGMSLPFCVLTHPIASPEIRFSCFPLTCLSLVFLLAAGVQRMPECEYFLKRSPVNNELPSCKIMYFM